MSSWVIGTDGVFSVVSCVGSYCAPAREENRAGAVQYLENGLIMLQASLWPISTTSILLPQVNRQNNTLCVETIPATIT